MRSETAVPDSFVRCVIAMLMRRAVGESSDNISRHFSRFLAGVRLRFWYSRIFFVETSTDS